MRNLKLTLLTKEQVWGPQWTDSKGKPQLEVIGKYGIHAAVTDLAVLTGAYSLRSSSQIDEDHPLRGRVGRIWTQSDMLLGNVYETEAFIQFDAQGNPTTIEGTTSGLGSRPTVRSGVIRPVIQSPKIFSLVSPNRVKGEKGTEEVEFGEYPQYVVTVNMQNILETEHNQGRMNTTGNSYTFDSVNCEDEDTKFQPITYPEYEYQGEKYIRIRANITKNIYSPAVLSNGVEYKTGDYVWVEVSPVKWLIDDKTQSLVAKKGLVSGIQFLEKGHEQHEFKNYFKIARLRGLFREDDIERYIKGYKGNFKKTHMKEYLDTYMSKDLFQNVTLTNIIELEPEEKEEMEKERERREKERNPYALKFESVSEEEIIKGALESGVPVFLHGLSGDGKSARVKQIDPTCTKVYLRNATQESLNGKSVYNQATGEMIDIPPTWLKSLQEKCEKEPERLHVLFFDEITNAWSSVQGMAFDIILDRVVNGKWKLPDNVRIVAAGNDMKDSLAANEMAEPLFNRFAHVYIETTTEKWLKWASENNIHPAIYSYIASTNGKSLRSEYNGETPNADPRKWEMASKMLYATGNPEMLRALVGKDITNEFVAFCKQPVITLDDVIMGNYSDQDIALLDTSKRYATTMGLVQVDDNNLEKIRSFVAKLGEEFVAVFDTLWVRGDASKLERLAEARLAEGQGGIRR